MLKGCFPQFYSVVCDKLFVVTHAVHVRRCFVFGDCF